MTFFAATGVTRQFAGLLALDDVTFAVQEGEIVGLIGPNGAGKSTCFNVITGALKPNRGQVEFRGEDITGLRSDRIARRGICRTFQNTAAFMGLTVRENALAACYLRSRAGIVPALLGLRRSRDEAARFADDVDTVLATVGLTDVADTRAADLPYGLLRLLGIATALATQPRLLLMDEPAAGLNPTESAALVSVSRKLRDRGLTILLVEHDMKVIMDVCDRIVVLAHGRVIADGSPATVRSNPQVIASYLGARHQA
jgi:branched-chain amino acid transport system ATP-binding protein